MQLAAMIRLLRPKQWSKNVFVFAALVFTRTFGDVGLVVLTVQAFVAMCLLSSATYVANDLFDVERDRAHPKKRNRPLASGAVKIPVGVALCFACLFGGLALAFAARYQVMIAGLVYLLMQVIYNLGVKRIPIADVFLVALGFVLRACVGAIAIRAQISGWLLFCTGALALLLGFGKRRHEFMTQGDTRGKSRESLVAYTQQGLDTLVVMSATGAALCYGIYSVESATAKQYPALILSTLFVLYGVCRYTLLIFSDGETDEPESLVVSDPQMIVTFVLFAGAVFYALGGGRFGFIG